MKNEHKLKCPVEWDKVPFIYDWIAIDSDGSLRYHAIKPNFYSHTGQWQSAWNTKINTLPKPKNSYLCFWERNKTGKE